MPIYWQPVKCVNKDSPTQNTTNTIELPKAGAIGSLLIFIGSDQLNVARQTADWRLVDDLDLIEVKGNGTKNLKSVTGRTARALAWLDQRVFTPDVTREYATNTQFCRVLINFGERLFDRRRGLNAEKWDSLELKIKNSLSSTHFNSSTYSINAYAIMKRGDNGFPAGHFRTEEYKKWTTVATTWEYTDLPTEGKLRRLLLGLEPNTSSGVAATNPWNYATQIKYFLKSREVEQYDFSAEYMQVLNLLDYEAEQISHITQNYHDADYGLWWGGGYPLAWSGMSISKDGSGSSTVPTIGDETNPTVKPESYEGDSPFSMLIKGLAPESHIVFRHDRHADLTDMLDLSAPDVKPATFDVYSKNASGINRIILDRLFTAEGKD